MSRSSLAGRLVAGRARKAIVGIAVVALTAIPISSVLAGHQFTDVPTTSPYHSHISAIANALVTGGCSVSPPKYCPRGNVTREQMAVFLDRIGNLSNENGPITDALTVVGQLTVYVAETFTLTGSVPTECQQSENAVPLATDLPYLVTAQLTDAPGVVLSSTINVSVDDPDPQDEVFDVCFSGIGGNTTAGAHKVVESLSLDLGSGLFASASAASRSNVLDIVKSWKN